MTNETKDKLQLAEEALIAERDSIATKPHHAALLEQCKGIIARVLSFDLEKQNWYTLENDMRKTLAAIQQSKESSASERERFETMAWQLWRRIAGLVSIADCRAAVDETWQAAINNQEKQEQPTVKVEPVYLRRVVHNHTWQEVNKQTYEESGPSDFYEGRILYTSPQPERNIQSLLDKLPKKRVQLDAWSTITLIKNEAYNQSCEDHKAAIEAWGKND